MFDAINNVVTTVNGVVWGWPMIILLLGTHIFSSIDMRKNKILALALTLSSLVGGLIFFLIGNISLFVLAIISIITFGMLIYISIVELLPEILSNLKKKEAIIGVVTGIIIVVISMFI